MTEKERKNRILQALEETYPEAGPELHFTNPYETLVATILSAQCTDKQVNRVTPAVFARYPDANAMAKAEVDELFPLVKSCGFRSKAGNIIAACRILSEQYGGEVPDNHQRRALRRLRHSRLRGGHPCLPGQQPDRPVPGGHRGGDGTPDDPPDSGGEMGPGASLADLARPARLQGAAAAVRGMPVGGMVPEKNGLIHLAACSSAFRAAEMPSSAAETIPPAYPAPSPTG